MPLLDRTKPSIARHVADCTQNMQLRTHCLQYSNFKKFKSAIKTWHRGGVSIKQRKMTNGTHFTISKFPRKYVYFTIKISHILPPKCSQKAPQTIYRGEIFSRGSMPPEPPLKGCVHTLYPRVQVKTRKSFWQKKKFLVLSQFYQNSSTAEVSESVYRW